MDPAGIERLGADLWPSRFTEERDGWLLRHTPGFDRWRNNSALPLGTPGDIATVEEFAAERGIPPVVQVGPLHEHAELDAELERRGWEMRVPVDVLVADARHVALTADWTPVVIRPVVDDRWLDAWRAAEGRSDVEAHAEHVFPRMPTSGFAIDVRGTGTGIVSSRGDWGAIFCMAVRPESRGGGIGARLLAALANWTPARSLFLQVDPGNLAAQALYARAGFELSHRYHFRLR